jgi:uncharacterized protein (DUF4415 family)
MKRTRVTKMSEDIKNRKWTEAEKAAVRRAAAKQAAGLDHPEKEYDDIPRLTADQLARMVRLRGPRRKQAVSVRLDPKVLDWLKSKGEGHLTRINDILTNLMEAERGPGREGRGAPGPKSETRSTRQASASRGTCDPPHPPTSPNWEPCTQSGVDGHHQPETIALPEGKARP